MEGIPGWWFLAIFVVYAWMVLSAVPMLVAVGLLLAGRGRPALMCFAIGLFSEAAAWAAFVVFLGFTSGLGVSVLILGLSLFSCGAALFIAALRTGRFVLTLAWVAAAALVVAANSPMRWGIIESLGLPKVFHELPEWHSMPVALGSLALATVSLICALRRGAPTGESKAKAIAQWFSRVEGGTVDILFDDRPFGGRAGDSSQHPKNYSYDGTTLIVRFATGEVLTVEEPADFVVRRTGDLVIPHSRTATFGWHSYGQAPTPANWCEEYHEGACVELVRWGGLPRAGV